MYGDGPVDSFEEAEIEAFFCGESVRSSAAHTTAFDSDGTAREGGE